MAEERLRDDTPFSADRPISGREHDRLGRTGFAQALARAVRGWVGRDSLVIALYGSWGSGKSSLKNMVLEELHTGPADVCVTEFNPWRFAGSDHLHEAFFDELGLALGKGKVGSREDRKKLLRTLRRYSAYLKGGGQASGLIGPLVKAAVFTGGVFLLGIAWVDAWHAATLVGATLVALAALLHWSRTVLETVEGVLSVGVEIDRPSLEEVRGKLRSLLLGRETPVLVVLDDLDRLTPDELREMLQIVKANADFPNLVYLLLCDRDVVQRQIGTALGVDGRSYLEKVVQAPFDVPLIERQRVHEVLFEGLNRMLAAEEVSARFDSKRWGNLFLGGLQGYFSNLRHVNRFLSTLEFHLQVFRNGSSFEVNPVDLIALEGLRVFEPDLYHALPRFKSRLLGEDSWVRDRSAAAKDQERAEIVGLADLAAEVHRPQVKEALKQLFPQAEWAFGGNHYGAGFSETWSRELRVCSEDTFDRYFHLAIPKGDVSQAHLDRILADIDDLPALRSIFTELERSGLLGAVVNRLEDHKERLPEAAGAAFVSALFDLGERLPQGGQMFSISAEMHVIRVVHWFLKSKANAAERVEIVKKAISETHGLASPVHFIEIQQQALDKQGREGDALFDQEAVTELKALCVERIARAAASDALQRNPSLVSLLYRWRDWGDQEAPSDFCRGLITTKKGATVLIAALASRVRSQGIGDRVASEKWVVRLRTVEDFVPAADLEAALVGLDLETASKDERQAVEAFQKALARRIAGKTDVDDGPFWDDDEE